MDIPKYLAIKHLLLRLLIITPYLVVESIYE